MPAERQETISVGYAPITIDGWPTGYYHKYLIYTKYIEETGRNEERVIHGGPENLSDPGNMPSIPDCSDVIFGDLEATFGPAAEQFDEGEWVNQREPNDYREAIIRGRDLSELWGAMEATARVLHNDKNSYNILNRNSNSLVDTILHRAGLPLPSLDGDSHGEYHSPGSDQFLPENPSNNEPCVPRPADPGALPALLYHFYNPPVSPLVLDLDGDGAELVALADSQAWFDLDSDGFAQHTGWVAPDDALLALDRNGNGRIDNIGEVFGNGTTDSFTELRALDSNDDGRIDASDDRFDELLLWRDLNGNGWSEDGELQSLADGGVRSIDLNAAVSAQTIAGHRISHTSSFTRTDGTTATIVDAWFENDRHISVPAYP